MLTKKTIHNLLNLKWSSAFKWKRKVTGKDSINYGGHKWQLPDERVLNLLSKAGFDNLVFQQIDFPSIRIDRDTKKIKWKAFLNRYLPKWHVETRFTARAKSDQSWT